MILKGVLSVAVLEPPVILSLKQRLCDFSMEQVHACLKIVRNIQLMNIRHLELVHRDRGWSPIEASIGGDRGATDLETGMHLEGSRSVQGRLPLACQIICEAELINPHLVHDTHY